MEQDDSNTAPIYQTGATYAEVENILRMALTAPSGDNSQPWRFTWNDTTLAIFYVSELGSHALNNANHATWLSLGCLLEAISVSASGFKLRSRETLDFENWHTNPVALVTFHRDQFLTDPLISEVYRRRTSRFPFTMATLPDTVLEELKAEAQKFPLCHFSFRAGPPTAIYEFLEFCDEFMWKNSRVAQDFLTWTRLTDRELAHRNDGLAWMGLGIKKTDLVFLRFFRRFPFLISLLWNLGFRQKVHQTTRNLLQSNAGTYCIAIPNHLPKTIFEAGRFAYRLWLNLSSKNFAVQPLSLASLTTFDILSGSPPPETSQATIEKLKAGAEKVKSYFGLNSSQSAIWIFRTGKPAEEGMIIPSPRVNIQERLKVSTRAQKAHKSALTKGSPR